MEEKKNSPKSKKTQSKATEKKRASVQKEKVKKTETKISSVVKTKETKNPKKVRILGFHDLALSSTLYENVENPKAVILIAHGMMEHSRRYVEFAKFLNKNGYIAITTDLRGHGETAENLQRRGFGEKDIYNETIADLQNLIVFAKENYNLSIYYFGHSYGSLLGQRLIQVAPDIEKAVLCGTTNGSCAIMKLGGMVCSLLSPFKGKNSMGGLIEKLCIKGYGKKFENGNWLTRDEKVFEEYCLDDYCGGSFPFNFYKSMIRNCNKNNRGIAKIGQKKLFLIVGDQDPVSSGGKHAKNLHKIYLKNNVNSKFKIYKDCRHELLNELNKKEVWQDVLDFYNY